MKSLLKTIAEKKAFMLLLSIFMLISCGKINEAVLKKSIKGTWVYISNSSDTLFIDNKFFTINGFKYKYELMGDAVLLEYDKSDKVGRVYNSILLEISFDKKKNTLAIKDIDKNIRLGSRYNKIK